MLLPKRVLASKATVSQVRKKKEGHALVAKDVYKKQCQECRIENRNASRNVSTMTHKDRELANMMQKRNVDVFVCKTPSG